VAPAVISAFAVGAEADAALLSAWENVAGAALYRALRSDVAPRFVAVSPAEPPATPFPAHVAAYEPVHEDGEPEGAGGTVLIAPYEVPAGADERFAAAWEELRARLAPRQGYLGARLYRGADGADFRFVALVRWSSPLMYARALKDPEIAGAVAAIPCPGHPALYLAVP
jgi:hypothetical protein